MVTDLTLHLLFCIHILLGNPIKGYALYIWLKCVGVRTPILFNIGNQKDSQPPDDIRRDNGSMGPCCDILVSYTRQTTLDWLGGQICIFESNPAIKVTLRLSHNQEPPGLPSVTEPSCRQMQQFIIICS